MNRRVTPVKGKQSPKRRGAKPAKAKVEAKRPVAAKSRKHEGARVGDLERRLAEVLKREDAALENQTATSEILRTIAHAQSDVQPVFDTIVRSAARLCHAVNAAVFLTDGTMLYHPANYGSSLEALAAVRAQYPKPLDADTTPGRAILTRSVVQVPDTEAPAAHEHVRQVGRLLGFRSVVAVPMLRAGEAVGAINVSRPEPGGLSGAEVELLKTFADQAVIAIENVRLFKELQDKNEALTAAHAQVTEALQQQTATSEILRVISSSPTDVQPVFDTIVRSASRLCGGEYAIVTRFDGELLHLAAQHNPRPGTANETAGFFPQVPRREASIAARALIDAVVVHVADVETEELDSSARETYRRVMLRAAVAVPMVHEGRPIGVIGVSRGTPGPFSRHQIDLLQTFADQAVIAIENVRLFNETKEALEQQTATSEILRVISQSQTDVQPVFDTIASNARRLCNASSSAVFTFDGELIHLAAQEHMSPQGAAVVRGAFPMPPGRGSTAARAIMTRSIAQITGAREDPEYVLRDATEILEFRSVLAVPMLRDGHPIGAVSVGKAATGPFPDKQIALLQTFADQAVIAVENVRLFTELREKNQALTQAHAQVSEALEQQTATSEVLKAISRSTFDLEPVLDTLIENAARLCNAQRGVIVRRDGDVYRGVAFYNASPDLVDFIKHHPITPGRHTVAARVALERRTIHVADLQADTEYRYALRDVDPIRTELGVPMLRGDDILGVIILYKLEVQPFTDTQIELLQTFADQAVIAIENVRLFKELEARNRDLTEALDQQTATSEILRVISSSHTDLQPVFDAILHSAGRLCDATFGALQLFDGEELTLDGHYGISSEDVAMLQAEVFPMRPDVGSSIGRAIIGRATVHIEDIRSDPQFKVSALQTREGYRTALSVPMLRGGVAVGVINLWRRDVRPFSQTQIDMVQTFADQAVIAIENVRLFKELNARTGELTRSVNELTALGEVSRTLSSSLDLETVLRTIVIRANQLGGTAGCVIWEYDESGEAFRLRASHYADERDAAILSGSGGVTTIPRGQGLTTQVVALRQPVQISDIAAEGAYDSPVRQPLIDAGHRALLGVPLLSEGEVIGVLAVTRKTPGEFNPDVVRLLSTFATQSALAIQNARLFREIEVKGRELEAASRHKSEFLANMSHELRTPLNAIIGFSEVLGERMFGELNEKQEEYLKDIYASGQHLLSLINDILDLSKIEAGRMELELADFHLPQAIENALVLVRERALRRGITLEQSIDPRLGEIRGDERKVKQVLLNLLSNAIKFTPEGGGIEVRAKPVNGAVEVSVSDTGVGIAPEDQQAIFEEFRQVGTAAKKVEGTGLGLALSRKFIELHGGRIWVQSQVDIGSRFTFTIPVRRRE